MLYVDRVVRVTTTASATQIAVSDITAKLPSSAGTKGFRILKCSVWALGAQTCTAVLSGTVWGTIANGSTAVNDDISYTDIAPSNRLAGVMFNIPDPLTNELVTSSILVITGLSSTSVHVADFTVRFQI